MAVARIHDHRAGTAALEFALVGPLLILLLMGMVVYGGWFWLAQSVQSVASETARAAVGGLDAEERQSLGQAFFDTALMDNAALEPDHASVQVASDGDAIRVSVRYDVADHPIMAMTAMLPSPPKTIERNAVVRIGGY